MASADDQPGCSYAVVMPESVRVSEMRSLQSIFKLLSVMAFVAATNSAQADHLPGPVGDVLLTIKGQMEHGNMPDGAQFDLGMLRNIGVVTFSTSTPWTEGVQDFTGLPLNQLLAHIGAQAAKLTVTAVNEYQIDIPASDAMDGGPILAWEQGGKLLSVREKGPLWLVYPFDSKREYRSEQFHARAVWQVVQIDLKP